MEAKQPPSSVIAKLMGFDEFSPPRKHIHGPNRVLSEDYLRKSDSICSLKSQSYRKRRLSKADNKTGQNNVILMDEQGREKLHRNSRDTNSSVEMADASHSPSKIVILRPFLGEKSEMMLNFYSKTSNRLLEKWKMTRGSKRFVGTRRSNATIANCGTLDKLENASEIGNDGEEISAHFSSDFEYAQATKDMKATHDAPTNSSANNQGCPYTFDDFLIGQNSSVSSSHPKIDQEPHLSPGEYYSPSPNSVLDPLFNEESLSSSDSFENIGADPSGLQKQLQLLESQSEEHGMVVSNDGDSGDESVNYHIENMKFMQFFRPEESRDSSYVDDVLDSENLFNNNTKLGSKACHSLELPLNPSIFEMLEKKYEKQSSWDKSERRLLFDRINLGLREILYPYADAKPLRKSFKMSQSREAIENELWRFLTSHENGIDKTLSEKAVGTETKWLDLRDDVEFIVCELEHFLFEELLGELFYD